MANSLVMDDPRRARIEARIMERLGRLDEATLRDLDAWLAQDEPATGERRGLTRRQLLALIGGAAVVGAGGLGAGALLLDQQATPSTAPVSNVPAQPIPEVIPTQPAFDIEGLNAQIAALGSENDTLNERLEASGGLLGLYEQLDEVGLDRVVESGMGLVATALGRVAVGAAGLREGLRLAQQRLNELDQSFVGLDSGLERVEGSVTALANLMQSLEDRLRAAGEPVAPVAQALDNFFTGLLGRIPVVGERIVETIDRVKAIIGAIPESIENINTELVIPMRARFFPRDGDDITVRLIDPLTSALFTPADALLQALEEFGETWQEELQQPAREKLQQREDIRRKIAQYKSEKQL